jgi:apolipoprotein N-acyltransferase
MGWVVFLAWIPLLHFFDTSDTKLWKAAAIFAIVYVLTIFYWIAEVTPGGLVGIVILYFLYYLLCFHIIRRIGLAFPRLRYLAFVAVLLSFEYLQNFGEMRFPWFNNAYSLADYTLLIQAADLGGVILISALILWINVLIYKAFRGYRRQVSILLTILVLWIAYGVFCLKLLPLQSYNAKIAVMQPSIKAEEKWDQAYYELILERYEELCQQASQDSMRLIIFPEAAIPVYLLHDSFSLSRVQRLSSRYDLDIFTGFPHYELAPAGHVNGEYYYNAAALFRPDGTMSKPYYKNILVPIGERMLWLDYFPFLWNLQFGQANWEFGKKLEWVKSGGYEFSPSICYEVAFAGINQRMAIPRDSTSKQLRKTDYLVNITNDAWFGTSYGPWLHASMVKFRAVESRIQIYRSANTGISMIIDPLGRVIAKAGLFEVTNISAPLKVCPRIPLYRRIAVYPIFFVFLSICLYIISLLYGKKYG